MDGILHILGGAPLQGSATVSGSKNGALPTLAATLLFDEPCLLENVPRITDVENMLSLLRHCGARIEQTDPGSFIISNPSPSAAAIPAALAEKMRASYYLLGALLGRLGEASLPLPGGCNLGSRPVDYILRALEPLGITQQASDREHLLCRGPVNGGRVMLDPHYRSPGATFSVLMATVLAEGQETIIENACAEPDAVSFCRFLIDAGANIQGVGSPTLQVRGVRKLNGAEHRINGDRLEAGTLLLAGAASRGEVVISGVKVPELQGFIEELEKCGVEIKAEAHGIRASCRRRPRPLDVSTAPFPGFPTDLQPPMMAFLATAEGNSRVEENIFDGRMSHVAQLQRMGAKIAAEGRGAIIHGVERLQGADLEAENIRAGAALVVAAVGAEGDSRIRGLEHITRGYEKLEEKLAALGADARLEPAL
jgi:UDP-N-acetylglucosamine 1-carboxyvinyltransferase